jgi:DNA (cytosine-5)-methyltransferase 3A
MNKPPINVISLFDGISCGQLALETAGVNVGKYLASEIEKDPIEVTQRRFPNTLQLGNVKDVVTENLPFADLCIGGSPCQSFSRSGDNSGFDGKSGLFFEYVRILKDLKEVNPNIQFLLENVVMKKEWQNIISEHIGLEPVLMDAKYFSAQKRQRLIWTNIPIDPYVDKDISIKDVMDMDNTDFANVDSDFMWFEDGEYRVRNATKKGYLTVSNYDVVNLDFPTSKTRRGRVSHQKSNTLNTGCNQGIFIDGKIIKLNALECERLQTIEDNHTMGFTEAKRKKMIGNAWPVAMMAHIFKNIHH